MVVSTQFCAKSRYIFLDETVILETRSVTFQVLFALTFLQHFLSKLITAIPELGPRKTRMGPRETVPFSSPQNRTSFSLFRTAATLISELPDDWEKELLNSVVFRWLFNDWYVRILIIIYSIMFEGHWWSISLTKNCDSWQHLTNSCLSSGRPKRCLLNEEWVS